MQVSEIDNLPYYELEYTIEYYQEILEERNKEEEKQNKDLEGKYNINQYKNVGNMSKFKMPSMPNVKMPSIPKL